MAHVGMNPDFWRGRRVVVTGHTGFKGSWVSLWLSALNVKYRDVASVVPLMTQLWMFASPVLYPASLVPESFRFYYGLNPMAGVIEGFRWALLGKAPPDWDMVAVSLVVVAFLLVGGVMFFRRVERTFADLI